MKFITIVIIQCINSMPPNEVICDRPKSIVTDTIPVTTIQEVKDINYRFSDDNTKMNGCKIYTNNTELFNELPCEHIVNKLKTY